MQLTIKHNFPQVEAALSKLQSNIAAKVTARAVNRTIDQGKTAMRREIRAEFNISAAKVNEKLTVRRATFKGGVLRVEAALMSRDPNGKRRSTNVINFAARQVRGGVSVKIRKTGGRQVIKGAFIGNAGRTVFRRDGKDRLPISPVQTIDVQQMFNTKRINSKVVKFIEDKFPEVFSRELAYELSKFNGA